jgi:hypothetical protein
MLLGLCGWRYHHFACVRTYSRPEEALLLNYSPLYSESTEDNFGVGVGDVELLGGSKTSKLMFCYKDY